MNRLIWLDVDLRVNDNPVFNGLSADSQGSVLAFYNFDPPLSHSASDFVKRPRKRAYGQSQSYGLPALGGLRKAFLQESLTALEAALNVRGVALVVCEGDVLDNLGRLIAQHNIHQIITAFTVDYDRHHVLSAARRRWAMVDWQTVPANTLLPLHSFDGESLQQLYAGSFSHFRRQVDQQKALQPVYELVEQSGYPPFSTSCQTGSNGSNQARSDSGVASVPSHRHFPAGERAAQEWLWRYFSSAAPQTYKQTRNALYGDNFSTQLSVYLSRGSLSVRAVLAALRNHEVAFGQNESTRWIEFELLWRDYFYGYALLHGKKLFLFAGIAGVKPLTSHYAQRFKAWCAGNTPWPLVNAAMRELVQTGWLSNRARQIVASALVNELNVDWRYGAAFFQQSLLDYDVAINWGNWQYIAGVGADPRGGRHFNLEKQQVLFDPDNRYVDYWRGASTPKSLDTVDAADWPIGS
ncbi:MAG TPA: DASH family cryptochrome [Marinagarivorans sp.]